MTLDEAIRIEEETARRSENHLEYNRSHKGHEYEIAAGDCEQSMIYHRQLAEWLTDYKKLKEKEEPKMVGYIADGYSEGYLVFEIAECPNCGEMWHKWDNVDCWESPYCNICGQALKWEEEE